MMSNIASGEAIMEGGLAVLCPFQQCFSHFRTMGDDQERLCAMEPCLQLRRFRLGWALNSGLLDQY